MPINPDSVGAEGEEGEFSWTSKDSLLYSLGVGAGVSDPTGAELDFTTENSIDVTQKALPTMVVVLGQGAGKGPDFGDFDLTALVHGGQSITLHETLPPEGTARSKSRVANIFDKGKAAIVVLEGTVTDTSGNPLWSTKTSLFIRGEGGWGGDRGPASTAAAPDRAADEVVSYTTRTDQALLYRLNGDRNPLHSDPQFAALAGFPKPILHGLCTWGFTGRALLHAVCDSDPSKFGSMEGRFSTPVMPGEQLDIHIWNEDDGVIFQTKVGDNVVLDAGQMTVR
ncbi:MAG: MaoC family dehydratase N-terminal domain-containing protein [Acidobacteria bacterium]|nr:MaoC family dehydratase N-terminal domain-containing protein [Acidobacteriota bacterium]